MSRKVAVMPGVRLSEHFGLVIRKEALHHCGLDRSRLLTLMETDAPFDEDDDLLSFGPHFGGEACQTLVKRLESAGLNYGLEYRYARQFRCQRKMHLIFGASSRP